MADDQKDKERLKKALDAMIFLPHLKDRQAQSVLAALIPDDKASRATGRPWDRGDLFRRLKTFKSSTWFAKPNSISAEECARRGWQNTETDVITCESCKAIVSCPIPMQLLPDEAQKVAEKYAKQICQAHAVGCPWRSTTCSISLLHFPHMPKSAVNLDFEERLTSLKRVLCLPPLAFKAVETMLSGSLGPTVAKLIESGPVGIDQQQNQQKNNTAAGAPAGAASSNSNNDVLVLTSGGVSTCDQEAYIRRLRAISLCGWGLEVLSNNSLKKSGDALERTSLGDDGQVEQVSQLEDMQQQCRMGPESAMLSCALCGAKAGLWTNFPECTPQPAAAALAAAISPNASRKPQTATAVTVEKVGGGGGAQVSSTPPAKIGAGTGGGGGGKSPLQSPGGGTGGVLHRHVAVNVATTIAGGSIDESDNNVFGSTGGVFGRGPSAAPAFGSTPPPPSISAAGGAATTAAAAVEEGEESTPVFGFAALRAAEPGAVSSTHVLVQQGAKRRRDDAAWVEATISSGEPLDNDNGAGIAGDKRQRTTPGGTSASTQAPIQTAKTLMPPPASLPAAALPTQAVLQQYRRLQSTPLDPLALHRRFCPWVHAATTGTGGSVDGGTAAVLSGWQWCAQQLGPEVNGYFTSGVGGGDDGNEGGDGDGEGGRAAAWNPAAVLRNALSKVEVKKS